MNEERPNPHRFETANKNVFREYDEIQNESVDSTIERMLKGKFTKSENIHIALSKVSPEIDDLVLIPAVLRNIIWKEIDLRWREELADYDEEDRILAPLSEAFTINNIETHPDAHIILSDYLDDLFAGIIECHKKHQVIDQATWDQEIAERAAKFEEGKTPSEILSDYLKECDPNDRAADNILHWKMIIEPMLDKSRLRDYKEERLEKARRRWEKGLASYLDYERYMPDMINFTDNHELIKKLLNSLIELVLRKASDESEDLLFCTIQALCSTMATVNKILNIEPDNDKAISWHTVISELLEEKGIEYDPALWESDDEDDENGRGMFGSGI